MGNAVRDDLLRRFFQGAFFSRKLLAVGLLAVVIDVVFKSFAVLPAGIVEFDEDQLPRVREARTWAVFFNAFSVNTNPIGGIQFGRIA
jgi:hypothetical protein